MNIPTIRDYFEKENGDRNWFRSGGLDDASCDEGYVYEDYATDMCWTTFFSGWQASRESLVIELPACEYANEASEYSKGHRQGIRACREAIHASGVKTK